ncbi:MAG: aspartate/glutamate racemase family protein [Alicyclobacillus herbarius]|uniref:aspartate/glutamate racemase family protein n=1 Tax=Alicyclobacillus herbarius TaxID=122960 RepID=UPI0023559C9C|nr:aspartate/glutamate racemase family protein [Alicyclobacillus herbarius]MCL6633541.1 aspartate/glutamate racemase family protein [Alicyclobacillus herbarius]
MIGVIRVVTLNDQRLLEEHGDIIAAKYGLDVTSFCIPNQPYGIYNDETEREAVPKIIDLAERLEKDGVEAVVVSCAADPAVAELRGRLSIPVIGAGSSAALVARGVGLPAGVLGITGEAPRVVKDTLGDLFVGYAKPQDVTNTKDLLNPRGQQQAVQASRLLLEQGAKAIVFACTGYSTIGLANVLRRELDCVVVDGVEAEGLFTWYAVHTEQSALDGFTIFQGD